MNSVTRNQPLLGTFVEIHLSGELTRGELIALSTITFDEIRRIHNLMSFHDKNSELSHINHMAAKETVEISPDMASVLTFAHELSSLTDGVYDITIAPELMMMGGLPRMFKKISSTGKWRDIQLDGNVVSFSKELVIDLGGIAKGYAVDCAFNLLMNETSKLDQMVINAGGDMRMLNWVGEVIEIRHPNTNHRASNISTVMQASALATSAPNYRGTGSLIVDPNTGQALKSNDSVSVFASSCMVADALTKAIFLSPNPQLILDHYNASHLMVTPDTVETRAFL